jgi:hypothetical protein
MLHAMRRRDRKKEGHRPMRNIEDQPNFLAKLYARIFNLLVSLNAARYFMVVLILLAIAADVEPGGSFLSWLYLQTGAGALFWKWVYVICAGMLAIQKPETTGPLPTLLIAPFFITCYYVFRYALSGESFGGSLFLIVVVGALSVTAGLFYFRSGIIRNLFEKVVAQNLELQHLKDAPKATPGGASR